MTLGGTADTDHAGTTTNWLPPTWPARLGTVPATRIFSVWPPVTSCPPLSKDRAPGDTSTGTTTLPPAGLASSFAGNAGAEVPATRAAYWAGPTSTIGTVGFSVVAPLVTNAVAVRCTPGTAAIERCSAGESVDPDGSWMTASAPVSCQDASTSPRSIAPRKVAPKPISASASTRANTGRAELTAV